MHVDDPKPFGHWARKHIAHDPRWTKHYEPASLTSMLTQGLLPPLRPVERAGGQFLYAEHDVDVWLNKLDSWVAEQPARRAAMEAERQRRRQIAQEEEMARLRLVQSQLRNDQAAQEKFLAERDAWEAEQKQVWERANAGR